MLESGSCMVAEEAECSRLAAACESLLVVNGYPLAARGESSLVVNGYPLAAGDESPVEQQQQQQ